MNFWSVNPYVGCEFGCSYCYARFAHQYVVERAGLRGRGGQTERWTDDAFEREIFIKTGAPEVLALTLKPSRLGGHAIVIGTATDPYQPAERSYRITRRILEKLAQFHGLSVGIISKSPLIARDIDVLRRIADRSDLFVHVSLISTDAELVRLLEPRTPIPAVRLRGLEQLANAGIKAGVMMAPVVPGISDDIPRMTALVTAAKNAGAAFVQCAPLRLYANVRRRFLPVIAEHFPALLSRYENAFDARGIVTHKYARGLQRRMTKLRLAIGVGDGKRGTGAQGHGRGHGGTGAQGHRGTGGYGSSMQWSEETQAELAL